MALAWKDRVGESTTTENTGTLTLAGALTGYQSFSAIGDSNTVYYMIEAVDGSGIPTGDWEVGKGTYTSAGTTLSRTTVLAGSNGTSLVNFGAGTKYVFGDHPAARTAVTDDALADADVIVGDGGASQVKSEPRTNFASVTSGIVNGVLGTPTVASSALTISFKGLDSTDHSETNRAYVFHRSTTAATGSWQYAAITAAVDSLVVPSGATLGFSNGSTQVVWVFLVAGASSYKLGVVNCSHDSSSSLVDNIVSIHEDSLFTIVPISTGSDLNGVFYADDYDSGDVTITNASPAVLTWVVGSHSPAIANGRPVVLTTTGSLPTGFTVGTTYYVVNAGTDGADKFRLATSPGGADINTSSAGSGTHTAHVGYTNAAIRILGYLEWSSGLATAGTWDAAPTKTQPYSTGVPLPGQVVQRTIAIDSSMATGTTTIPADDTIPQNTEGNQFMSLAITPKSACNIIRVTVDVHLHSGAAALFMGIWKDTTGNCANGNFENMGGTRTNPRHLVFEEFASNTTARTYKMRAGTDVAGTVTFNGYAGARFYGGVVTSSMMIEEIKV